MPFKDKCNLCGRVFAYSYLKKCWGCRRLFCVDCMVPEVSTGDAKKMLCLNCARKVVSPKSKPKYMPLTEYLKFRAAFTDSIKLSFAQIDGIIRDNLPMNAYRSEKWWANSPYNTHAKAWLEAGWEIHKVNLKEGYVILQKVKNVQKASFQKKESRPRKSFTPPPFRIKRRYEPSKTKIAKLYARLKNIERRSATKLPQKRVFKPKT
ncbi:MAG: hypothetical protein QXX79_03220 [Candidatus Bathyarchaeia archaeon]